MYIQICKIDRFAKQAYYRYFRSLDITSVNNCKNENFRFQTRFMGFSGFNEGFKSIKLTFLIKFLIDKENKLK
jgi:hypothetical protein